jgi:PPP family 3-phenylpropionic acid transporter
VIEVFYFFFFQSVGAYQPFLAPYLRALGFSGREISLVLSLTPAMALVVPLGWAWLADRTKQHARVLQLVSLGACLGLLPMVFARSFGGVLAGWFGYAFFNVGISGLADSLAITRVRAGADYGRMRLWGSVGFLVAALVAGGGLTIRGARPADPLVPVFIWLALAAAFAAALRLRGAGESGARPRFRDLGGLIGEPRFRLLLLVGLCHWAASVPYNVYFGVLLQELHLSPLLTGLAFSIGVASETMALLFFRRLRARFGLETMLVAVFAATSVRWLAIAGTEDTAALLALQLVHGLTFGVFWGTSIALLADVVPPELRATGQALFVMALNLGTALGNAATGALYDAAGTRTPFFLAAIAELVPLALAVRGRRALRIPIRS